MTKEDLAAKLNGREYTNEMTDAEAKEARNNGLLVIFGASDDLVEFRGTTNDEADANGGTTIYILGGKVLPGLPDKDSEEWATLMTYGVLAAAQERYKTALVVTAHWCAGRDYSWTYSTDAPHATFDIMDVDGIDKYCRGIVLNMK